MVNDRPTVYNTSSVYKEAGGGGSIPDTYKQIIYLRNKNNGWVKIPTDNIYGWGVEGVFALNSYSASGPNGFFSHRGDSNDILGITPSDKRLDINNHTFVGSYTLSDLNNFEPFKINIRQNNTNNINGVVSYGSTSINVSVNSNARTMGTYITLFRDSDNPFGNSKRIDIYYFKFFNTKNELMLDLVPVIRTGDNAKGFFDKLTNNFYACEGQGDLEPGPII